MVKIAKRQKNLETSLVKRKSEIATLKETLVASEKQMTESIAKAKVHAVREKTKVRLVRALLLMVLLLPV
jgi:hypothetical protein